MSAALRKPRMTRKEFLDWAQAQDIRYEFDGFGPVAMTDGTANHSQITQNILVALRVRLRGGDCRLLGPDAGVATVGSAVRYPDALVTCAKVRGDAQTIPGVVVVFEVLSPTSGRTDRIIKLREYRSVGTIRRYVILEHNSVGLAVFTRQREDEDWTARALTIEDTLQLPEIGLEIPVAELYENVDLPETDAATAGPIPNQPTLRERAGGAGPSVARSMAEDPMTEPRTITAYIDYKSPYAYLAKDPVYELERDFGVHVDWLPYVLDIPSFLGSARVDDSGKVIEEQRNPHQWRRVRYSYMDCRRQARKRGLVIRGPQKIWDSTLAAFGMLYAKRQGDAVLRRYNDLTFERFWRRELDIEDPGVISAVLEEAAADAAGFSAYLAGEGREELERLCRAAEANGVFGVPSFVVDGELFWGREHLPDIRAMLAT